MPEVLVKDMPAILAVETVAERLVAGIGVVGFATGIGVDIFPYMSFSFKIRLKLERQPHQAAYALTLLYQAVFG